MTENQKPKLQERIEVSESRKEKAIKALEEGIGSADRYIVRILTAGLMISIMITIVGGIWFIITQFIPDLGWDFVLSLPLGLQIALFGGILFILFGLLTLFNIIWKRGYYQLLKWFYSITD